MTQVRVTSCKERKPDPKMYSDGSDGYVYTLEYDDPSKPTRYVILWDYAEDLFKENPSCSLISQECLDYMNAKAQKDGNKGYIAVDQLHLMKKFPPHKGPASFTEEPLTPEELKAMQDYEIERAKAFQKKHGHWPLGLLIALPRNDPPQQDASDKKLTNG